MDSITKICSKCKQEKSVAEFGKKASVKDGLQCQCKSCISEYSKANSAHKVKYASEWRKNNIERARASIRERRKKKPKVVAPQDGVKTCSDCKTEKHVSEFNRCSRHRDGLMYNCRECEYRRHAEWREENREKLVKRQRAYRFNNKERLAVKKSEWNDKNKEKLRASRKKWSDAHPDSRRERVMRRNAIKKNATIGKVNYSEIWNRDKGVCYLCGKEIERSDCHFDHIIPLSKGGSHTMSNIAATHSVCNMKKSRKIIDLRQEDEGDSQE